MLEHILPGKPHLRRSQLIPPFLASLVTAAESGRQLLPYVKSVAEHLGFDHFMHGATAEPRPDRNGRSVVYTTMSPEWVERYDRLAYIECDPRIYLTCRSAVPLIWDQSCIRGYGAKIDAFLDDALAFDVASGVAFMFHGPLRSALTEVIPPPNAVAPLSKREHQCLALAAGGMTTPDISTKLQISARTVQFHFDTIRSKLGAANRQEAIALAVQDGTIRARAGSTR